MSMVLAFALFVGMCCALLGQWSPPKMATRRSASP
jgi:hypothetical protein